MKRNKYLVIICIILASLDCNSKNKFWPGKDSIKRIEITYLTWNLKPSKKLAEKDIRDYYGKSDHFNITGIDTIEAFISALSLINCSIIDSKNTDIRMVMDFYSDEKKVKTVLITSTKMLIVENITYKNIKLIKEFSRFIPETKAPY